MFDEVTEAGISGLGDLHAGLVAASRAPLSGVDATKVKKALQVSKGLLARRRRYLGGLREDEIRDLYPTPRTLFARRRTAAATIAAATSWDFFHKGVQDPATDLGYASGNLSEYHTNVRKDGRIPQMEVFLCNGLSFEFPDNIAIADMREFGRARVEWREASGTTVLPLCQVKEAPAVYTLDMEYGADDETDRNIRMSGPKFIFKKPLFIIRGALSRTDEGFLRVTHDNGFTLSADTLWTARAHGVWFQSIGRR